MEGGEEGVGSGVVVIECVVMQLGLVKVGGVMGLGFRGGP